MMPHTERIFRAVSNSWYPEDRFEDVHGCGFLGMLG